MKRTSLTRRAVTLVLASELLCALALSGTALLQERRLRLHAFDQMLKMHSDLLADAVSRLESAGRDSSASGLGLNLPSRDVFAIYGGDGQRLATSSFAPPALVQQSGEGFRYKRIHEGEYRIFENQRPVSVHPPNSANERSDRSVTVVYAASTNHIWHEILEAAGSYCAISLPILFATAALLITLLRRVLKPIGALAAAASGISTNDLCFKPPAEALQLRELQPLARALSETMERLRLAFEAQHRFVGDATHELKTAVAVVRSTIQVLSLKQRSPTEYREGLVQVLEDNSRVEDLVSRMLTLARFEEGSNLRREALALAEAVGCALADLQSFFEVHGVEATCALNPDLHCLLAREEAEVLVKNLIVNAVQHSPRGGTVQVRLEQDLETPPRALLRVEDSGSGISAEALPHLFERFYREDTSRSRDTGGAGLGLAICHAIVQAARGSIEVRSAPGSGTTVLVCFPVVQPPGVMLEHSFSALQGSEEASGSARF